MSSAGDSPGGGTAGDAVRASDAERDATVERLSQATGDGRLTLDEFSQRMERATTARTRGELDRLVTDLPVPAPAPAWPSRSGARRPGTSGRLAGSGCTGRGGWTGMSS